MCLQCKHKYGSNKHLFYWAFQWLIRLDIDKFLRTCYHILNRKAYRKWMNKHHAYKHLLLGIELIKTPYSFLEVPEEYVDYISNLDATDTLNEYYELK